MYLSKMNEHLLLLSNAVSSGLSLEVVLRVPVRVEDDNCVRCGQVHSQSPRSRREEKAKVLRTLGIKVINGIFTRISTDGTI